MTAGDFDTSFIRDLQWLYNRLMQQKNKEQKEIKEQMGPLLKKLGR